MKIALFYARKDVGGGSTTFTIHLYRALQLAGVDVTLYRLRSNESKPVNRTRNLAKYDGTPCVFVNQGEAEVVVRSTPSLLTAPEHSKRLPSGIDLKRLLSLGMRVVLHDPNEFKVYDHLEDKRLINNPICIRPTFQSFFPKATFIPHPYVREFDRFQGGDHEMRMTAATIARLTFVKRPEILLDANRLLDPINHIRFHGAENRLFTFARLKGKYPEFKQGGYDLPMVWGASARAIRGYSFMVDMTYFPDDGGGSQYTFMEAWDAGSVVVVNRDWLRFRGEMEEGVNCLAVGSAGELAELLGRRDSMTDQLEEMSRLSTRHLSTVHGPEAVAREYVWHLAGEIL